MFTARYEPNVSYVVAVCSNAATRKLAVQLFAHFLNAPLTHTELLSHRNCSVSQQRTLLCCQRRTNWLPPSSHSRAINFKLQSGFNHKGYNHLLLPAPTSQRLTQVRVLAISWYFLVCVRRSVRPPSFRV